MSAPQPEHELHERYLVHVGTTAALALAALPSATEPLVLAHVVAAGPVLCFWHNVQQRLQCKFSRQCDLCR